MGNSNNKVGRNRTWRGRCPGGANISYILRPGSGCPETSRQPSTPPPPAMIDA